MTARPSDLLPCPFCGNANMQDDEGCFQSGKYWEVRCGNPSCFAHDPAQITRAEAIAAWNTRTPARELDAGVGGDDGGEPASPPQDLRLACEFCGCRDTWRIEFSGGIASLICDEREGGCGIAPKRVTIYTAPPAAVVPDIKSSYPEIPEGWVLVPRELTAKSGAKAALMGKFSASRDMPCPECYGDDCEICDGTGQVVDEIDIEWDTIKTIYRDAIKHLTAKAVPAQEVG